RPPTAFPDNPYAIDETLRTVATRKPPSLATVRPDLPRDFILAIDAALAPEPDKRKVSCGEIARRLRKLGRVDVGRLELRELSPPAGGGRPGGPRARRRRGGGLPRPPRRPRPPSRWRDSRCCLRVSRSRLRATLHRP